VKQDKRNLISIHEKAEKAGIKQPVVIDKALIKALMPSPYLKSLGVSFEKRIENLLGMVNANLNEKEEKKPETKYYIPFMVLKGPMVCEGFLPVSAVLETDGNGRQTITLSQVTDDESIDESDEQII
jgi:hypothetical protein